MTSVDVEVDVHVGVDRDDHRRVLGRLADDDGLGAGVGELPAPLERVHVDGDGGLGVGDFLVLDDQRGREETEDDQDRHDGVEDLGRQVVLRLAWDVVALAAKADDGVDEEHRDEAADDDRADREPLPEVIDRTGLRRRALVGAEGGHGAPGEGQCREWECNEASHATPPSSTRSYTLWGQGR